MPGKCEGCTHVWISVVDCGCSFFCMYTDQSACIGRGSSGGPARLDAVGIAGALPSGGEEGIVRQIRSRCRAGRRKRIRRYRCRLSAMANTMSAMPRWRRWSSPAPKGLPVKAIAGFIKQNDIGLLVPKRQRHFRSGGPQGQEDRLHGRLARKHPFIDRFLAAGKLTRNDVDLISVDAAGKSGAVYGWPLRCGVFVSAVLSRPWLQASVRRMPSASPIRASISELRIDGDGKVDRGRNARR